MKVSKLSLISAINNCRDSANFTEYFAEYSVVLLEIGMELVKVSHTTSDSLPDLPVGSNWVLLLLNSAVKLEQLEVRLSVALLGSLKKELFGLVEVAHNTESLHVEDSEPVGTD